MGTEMALDYQALLDEMVDLAKHAGDEIMAIYRDCCSNGCADATTKSDGSPVTRADNLADEVIRSRLSLWCQTQGLSLPLVSEECQESHLQVPCEEKMIDQSDAFFLIDPLDGTKEFAKLDDKGAFTVNIALIESRRPTLGVVYAPALSRLFAGGICNRPECAIPAFELCADGERRLLHALPRSREGLTAVASVSHRDSETEKWLSDHAVDETISVGSSLKFCLLAAGEADVYPRFSPTMEWDTAAGQAILEAAGGRVCHPDGSDFHYQKPELKNGPFVAWSCGSREPNP